MTMIRLTRHSARLGALVAILGLADAGAAHAQAPGWGHGHGDRMFGLLQGVTLSDSQREQIHSYVKAGFQATKSTRETLRGLQRQVDALMLSSGSVSSASVTPLIQQEEQLKAQLDQERLSVALQVRSVLSASQIAQAAAAHSQLETLHQQEEAIVHPSSTAAPE
jgi:Spy/CpxP family protein refolding chaperone